MIGVPIQTRPARHALTRPSWLKKKNVCFCPRHSALPARFIHAAFDVFGQIAEVRIARRAFRPRIANANDRTPIKQIIGMALILHPTAMNETGLSSLPNQSALRGLPEGFIFFFGNADSHLV
jgi:hypothetical protein